jgi:hypothetical protein
MTRTNTPAEDVEALSRRMRAPEDARARRHEAHAGAATRQDVAPARLGAELAAEDRSRDETETADSLKRAAENDRRV